jgi:hypothetical protein
MAAKKARKQSPARKSAGAAPRKRTNKKADTKTSSPGLMSKAKKVVRAVVAGAAAGAVQGAVESGKQAAGLGQGRDKGNKSPQGGQRRTGSSKRS